MRPRLGTSFYCQENKQENGQNGGAQKKPYENLMAEYYLALPDWVAVVRVRGFIFCL